MSDGYTAINKSHIANDITKNTPHVANKMSSMLWNIIQVLLCRRYIVTHGYQGDSLQR